jgi:hypothetical protein
MRRATTTAPPAALQPNALVIEGGAMPVYNDGIHPDGSRPMIRKDSTGTWVEHNVNIANTRGMFRACVYYVPPGAPYRAGLIVGHGDIDGGTFPGSLGNSWAYNPTLDTYDNSLVQMDTTVGGNATFGAYGNGKGWVVGGMKGQASSYAPSDLVQTFDLNPSNGAPWTTLGVGCRLPTAVGQVAGFVDSRTGLIYVGGGTPNPDLDAPSTITSVTDFGVIDPVAGTYTALHALPFGVSQAAGVYTDNGKGLFIGGSTTTALAGQNSVLEYDIAANTWTQLGNFPINTSAGVACMKGGKCLAGLGWNATGFTDATSNNASDELYELSGGIWTLKYTLPADGASPRKLAASMMAAIYV